MLSPLRPHARTLISSNLMPRLRVRPDAGQPGLDRLAARGGRATAETWLRGTDPGHQPRPRLEADVAERVGPARPDDLTVSSGQQIAHPITPGPVEHPHLEFVAVY